MRLYAFLAMGVLAVGCSGGGGGGGGSSPNTPTCTGTNCTSTQKDAFGDTVNQVWTEGALMDESQPSTALAIFTNNCDTQGAPNPDPDPNTVADPRLKVGFGMNEYDAIWEAGSTGGLADTTLSETITALTPATKATSISTHLLVTESNGMYPLGATEDSVCTVAPASTVANAPAAGTVSCGPAATPAPLATEMVTAINHRKFVSRLADASVNGGCSVNAQPVETLDSGYLTVKMPDGSAKQIKAFKITDTYDGALNASTTDAPCSLTGNAHIVTELFLSNDVAAPNFGACGGTAMIQYRKVSQNNVTQRLDIAELREQQ